MLWLRMSCVDKVSALIMEQYGFARGRSTLTNLLIFNDYLTSRMLWKTLYTLVDAIYTDFSRAFDTVIHDLLHDKLWTRGIRGSVFKWLHSYLTGI